MYPGVQNVIINEICGSTGALGKWNQNDAIKLDTTQEVRNVNINDL